MQAKHLIPTMTKFSRFESYLPVILTSYWMILILRGIEFLALSIVFGWNTTWLGFESLGLLYDFVLMSGVLLIFYPLFQFIYNLNKKAAKGTVIFLFFLSSAAHFLILSYFIHQLIPLDIFLYQHPFEEIYFTITTSNISIVPALILIGVLALIPGFIYWKLSKKANHSITPKTGFYLMILGTFAAAFILLLPQSSLNKFTQNKSGFFYFKSIQYAFTPKHDFNQLNAKNIAFFHAQYPHKKFTSSKYPLIHERSKNDGLFEQMEQLDTIPNIVLLIVEGLSDEYVHNYHGVEMMPFLNGLKDSSLYWENCFTLGERSFAAVPSLLGGLPYGDLGFTLLSNFPRHHTLVNLLKSRNYHTSFNYGQAAWFHNKRNFFNYSSADWILDKESFDSTYNKIIVGDNDYFWGYNDKDLFSQYFKTLDSLPHSPYFNTFFTGTSHPPYVITNDKHYSKILKGFTSNENKQFVSAYGTYMKTIMFVDDAIKEFFHEYKKRNGYENTIFIITGDHPMSELPRVNELKKYHVPLLIYSPKLKKGQAYKHAVSHLDVSTTLLTFIEHYTKSFPTESASLGYSLFANDSLMARKYAFMDGNRGMYEYYADGFYLRKDELFKVGDHFSISLIKDKDKKEQLKKELENFKTINYRTSFNNMIMSKEIYASGLNAKVFYSKTDTTEIKSEFEYVSLVPPVGIPNRDFRAEINLDLEDEIKKNTSIVFEIKNAQDSILSWNSLKLEEEKSYQAYFNYKAFENEGNLLFFSIYIWNQEKEKVFFKNVDVLLRALENQH
jgi:uncharacterized sulfatase